MFRLIFSLFSLICLNACEQPQTLANEVESCKYVRTKLSPDGQSVILMETAPSGTQKTDNGFEAFYNFQRIEFKCDKSSCTSQQRNFTLPTNMQTPKIFWVQGNNKEILGLTLLDQQRRQSAVFLPNSGAQFVELNPDTYPLPNNSGYAFTGENWTYFSPMTIPLTKQSSRANITKEIEDQLKKITKKFDDFLFDIEEDSLGETFAIYSQSKHGVVGLTSTTYKPNVGNIVYNGQTKEWTHVANFSPIDQNIKLYASQSDDLILGGINRTVNVKNSKAISIVGNLDYTESLRTFPIINSSTGQLVGLSGLKSLRLFDDGAAEQAINVVIRKDLKTNPYLTVKQVEVSSAIDGVAFVVQYKNWQTDSSLFKFVKIQKNKDAKENVFDTFLPCPSGRQNKQKPNSVNLKVDIKSIGTETWPSRVLSLTQDNPKGAVIFLKGGPRGHIFDDVLLSRVYGPYLQRGFDVYAFEYSGMTLVQSNLDQRLHRDHEVALQKDIEVMNQYIKRTLNSKYHNLILHSESFGSILALGLLSKEDLFTGSVFASPWIQHHNPAIWQNSPEFQFAYEDYMFGIKRDGTGSFIDWMNTKRSEVPSLRNALVIIGEREVRGPRDEMTEFFRNKGAEVHILKNGTHEFTPVLSQKLIYQHIEALTQENQPK